MTPQEIQQIKDLIDQKLALTQEAIASVHEHMRAICARLLSIEEQLGGGGT